MKPFRPEHYFQVALERMGQANHLYREGSSFALSMYVAGVAVESMLRAFKGKRDPTFDEKHDLRKLFQASGLLNPRHPSLPDISEENLREYQREIQAAVKVVYFLWANDYRFSSEDRLRAHLKKSASFRQGIRGDILKASAFRLINACETLIYRGAKLWPQW